jgi:hypothetical protein
MKLGQKLSQVIPSLLRHLTARNSQPYEQILRHIRTREDIWVVSQGEYMSWWLKRENASLKITVSEGRCQIDTSLENAVIEKFPGEFLDLPIVFCEETKFSGEVWITLDSVLEKKELLIELLKREGIFNFRIADEGEFMLSQKDVGPLLEEIDTGLHKGEGRLSEDNVRAIRQIVIDKLAARRLPLLRIWYHPRVDGIIIRAVFSSRFDVDRAITNLAHIRALEKKYDVQSTLYLRLSCPFYTSDAIKKLASRPWCSEIALHGEFITHARQYGDEFRAAEVEKTYLEKLTGRSVLGVAMHGGELSYNRSEDTGDAIQKAGFLYDTTPGRLRYYFPFKRIVNGQISESYTFPHALSDFSLFPFKFAKKVVNGKVHKSYSFSDTLSKVKVASIQDYSQVFYEKTIAKMNEVCEQNGIFVITLHPAYFGFFTYLAHPRNWAPLFKFLLSYFKRYL